MTEKKVLITGAKGFVGSEIVSRLGEEHLILALENKSQAEDFAGGAQDSGGSAAKTVKVDITEKKAVAGLKNLGEIDVCVHAAGLAHQFRATPRESFQTVNVEGTRNVLDLALQTGVKHFIFISSVAVYGLSKNKNSIQSGTVNPVDETAECLPQDFYAESKFDAEKLCRRFCEGNGIKLTILRLATVIGEGDKGNLLNLIRAVDRHRFLWVGNGENYKSFIHKTDAARACGIVLQNAANDGKIEIYNISADFIKVREVVEIISRKLKKKVPGIKIPAALIVGALRVNARILNHQRIKRAEKTISKWLADDVYSAARIERRYGFAPEIESARAVEREVEWYLTGK